MIRAHHPGQRETVAAADGTLQRPPLYTNPHDAYPPLVRRRLFIVSFVALGAAPRATAHAQCVDRDAIVGRVVVVGSTTDDLRRIAQDLGRCDTRGSLIRSALSLTGPLDSAMHPRIAPVLPIVDVTYNSQLPFSIDDGALWAGRGLSTSIAAGGRASIGPLSISIAPELVAEQNRVFQVLPSNTAGRSPFASPWHSGIESADLPLRFGTNARVELFPGQSWIELGEGPVGIGVSSDNQWWGPAMLNAIVMSDNAPGIPQAFVRSRRPIATPIGDVEFRWIIGALTESQFFDTLTSNDLRSLNGIVATVRVPFDSGLTLGVERTVYAPVSSRGAILSHAFDVITRWNQTADTLAPTPKHPSDQLFGLFGRWVFPSAGFEVYAEWAKMFPPGLREMLVAPQTHQGYTLGLQWVRPLTRERLLRVQAELSTLEQTPAEPRITMPSFYTSRFVPQGYTQRGQVIGAPIGPGSSSQWLASDYVAPRWRAGIELGRIRWDDDAYYRTPNSAEFVAHDVSIFAGLRAGATAYRTNVDAELVTMKRLNYLFQNSRSGFEQDRGFDLHNLTLRIRVAPR